MVSACAFLPSLPCSSVTGTFRSRVSPHSSNHVHYKLRPRCSAQPPPGSTPSSADESPLESTADPEPTRNPIANFFASLRRTRRDTLARYGIAAVISYGLFDAVTYTASFLLSLRAYLAAGKLLTWRTLPQVLAVMWGINNLSRPFRVAGALALAPLVDRRVVQPVRAFLARRAKDS